MQPTSPAPSPETQPPSAPTRSVLPAEVSNFLVQFSIFLHQQAAYPAGHPILTSSASSAAMRLSSLMLDRESFAIGVAGDRMVIDGLSTDPSHSVLRELAEQLHRQQLGVVRFWRGVGPQELEDLVAAMAAARTADRPLGLSLDRSQRRWAHIQLEPHAYEQLLLAGEDGGGTGGRAGIAGAAPATGSASSLWKALAARAIGADANDASVPEIQQVARAIEARKDDAEYDRVIVEYLLQLGRESGRTASPDGRLVSGEFQEFLRTVPADTLRQLLQLGATMEQRRELVELASRDLPVNTVLLILNAAAAGSEQSISHNLLRILGKLALQADQGGTAVRPAAEAAVRVSVRRLLDQWSLKDPNPGSHTSALDRLARGAAPVDALAATSGSSALRIIHMSLEVGVAGAMLNRAIDDLIASGDVALLIDLLRQSGESDATNAAWDHLATPQALEQLLVEDIESATVEALIAHLGPRAAVPMIEALTVATSRTVRRRLLTWLRHLGPEIGPMVVERLTNSPWYVQRNLLGLLGSMPALPAGFSALPYAAHGDSRVRREAFKILFRTPEHYEEAVVRAIKDEDAQIVTQGLTMAVERFPPAASGAILTAIHRGEWASDLRVQAIRALALSTSPQVGRWLVEQALVQQRWFRRRKLAPRSPELLAALGVLAMQWSHEKLAAEALNLARISRDQAIRAAVASAVKS